ncbi:chemotaxis protein [Reinekea thalattae]|uniref:Chemotaxis protein CheV n=1 Tax=Reinekea thalattae TaxID=2593301 RepID=A0A5C8Z1E3_9GAMM|nr:chemotaxis protein [Reinekea thalattae]TXR51337.1 chemotaxis protein CheV [Reinekea thalattae]
MSSKAHHSQGLLLFKLHNGQKFAIGTLKVRELVPYRPITAMAHQQAGISGAVTIRDKTIPVIDMAATIGSQPIPQSKLESSYIVVTDCQRRLAGFLVSSIEKIIEANWRAIKPPEPTLGKDVFITGTVEVDGEIIQLMDVEVLFSRIYGIQSKTTVATVTDVERELLRSMNILVVDDSRTARKQLTDVLGELNVPFEVTGDGSLALEIMHRYAEDNSPIDILVSDIEMPGLDGYELAFEVRNDDKLAGAYIILHTSLSSEISVSQAHQVGANEALTKFDAKELASSMIEGAKQVIKNRGE